MVSVKRILLDILKPHHPSNLALAKEIAAVGSDYRVCLTVNEVDEKTETIRVHVQGSAIDFDAIQQVITKMGGALHSIDEVEVQGGSGSD